ARVLRGVGAFVDLQRRGNHPPRVAHRGPDSPRAEIEAEDAGHSLSCGARIRTPDLSGESYQCATLLLESRIQPMKMLVLGCLTLTLTLTFLTVNTQPQKLNACAGDSGWNRPYNRASE